MSLIYNASFDSQTRVLSLLDKAGNVISSCEVPSKGDPLTLTATADNSSVKLTKTGNVYNTYEVNTGSSWVPYTFGTVIKLNKGQSCKWRCTSHPTSFSFMDYVQFMMTGSIEASGEVYSMLSSNLSDVTTLNGYNYAFYYLFRFCNSLIKAPRLSATTLAPYCYQHMFFGCSSLTSAPELPATTLAEYCYSSMFMNCKSLTQAPKLPATTLAKFCYDDIFSGCSNLKEVRIAATTTEKYALNNWLKNVSATGDFYCDPNATIFPADSASGIPSGWTRRDINLLNALTLTATADNSSVKLTKNGTLDNTFEVDTGNGWTAYEFDTVIPLNAGQSCKWRCSAHPTTQSNQNYVQFVMTGTIEASGNCNSMLSSDFEGITSLTGYNYAFYQLFFGCTSLTSAPQLPATTLAEAFYGSMFSGCTSLTSAPQLPATTLAKACYSSMFSGCTSLTSAPQLPATTLAEFCYRSMFSGCTSLTSAPQLPATTLAAFCYYYMFSGCSNLKEVRISATTTASYALYNWLTGVSATGDFYCDPDATIFPTNSASGIPQNWTRRNIADYPATP